MLLWFLLFNIYITAVEVRPAPVSYQAWNTCVALSLSLHVLHNIYSLLTFYLTLINTLTTHSPASCQLSFVSSLNVLVALCFTIHVLYKLFLTNSLSHSDQNPSHARASHMAFRLTTVSFLIILGALSGPRLPWAGSAVRCVRFPTVHANHGLNGGLADGA